MRLLLVEDDISLAEKLKQRLKREGYAVDLAHNGIDGEHLGQHESYDAVVLDIGLPDRSGLAVLEHWRKEDLATPVLILTARDDWQEKVDGLKAGADDYLTKPFHFEELAARIQALIRRSKGQTRAELASPGFKLDEHSQSICWDDGSTQPLTGTEYRLLRYFLLNPDKILSKAELTEHVYAYDSDKDSNVIEVYVRRLREKLGKKRIQTQRGQGYVFRGSDR